VTGRRWFHVGAHAGVRDAVVALLGAPPTEGTLDSLRADDLVVVEAFADLGHRMDVVGGHAFAALRASKEVRGVSAYAVIRHDDPIGAQIARFCLADGTLVWDGVARLIGADELLVAADRKPRPSVEALLQLIQASLTREGGASVLQRLQQWERDDSLLHRLQDSETGLFDGPYASLKLDEEFKRAQRFHLPLSLLLLDIGAGEVLPLGPRRSELLAEVAGVFLNACRDIDVLARFTETTFLFLLPGTGPDGASVLARRMLAGLRSRTFGPDLVLDPRAGLVTAPATGIGDRKLFLSLAEVCLRRAQAGLGDGGLCSSWE